MQRYNAYGVKIEKLKVTLRHWRSPSTGVVAYNIQLFINGETDPAVVMSGEGAVKPAASSILEKAVAADKLPKPNANVSSIGYIQKLGIKPEHQDLPVKTRKELNANC